jgi:LacI family transcriptional regulator
MSRTQDMRKGATIQEVAQEANVSKSTVSLVLQGSDLIRSETAARVLEAARKLGYVYNRGAADLRRKGSRTIGVLINDLMNPFFAELLVGLERRLVDADYSVLMAHTGESLERQDKVLLTMREHNAAGIALCPVPGTSAALAKTLDAWGVPLVVIVRPIGPGNYDFAGYDAAQGLRLSTHHLIAAGHRRIAFLGGRPGPVYEQRLRGYQDALREGGIAFSRDLVFESGPTRREAFEQMRKVLDARPEIRAAVCYNDVVAFGALAALVERGLRAGADFALVGFDNVLYSAHSNPPLSTIDVRPEALGRHAAELLIARIENPGAPRQEFIAMPEFVQRQSG